MKCTVLSATGGDSHGMPAPCAGMAIGEDLDAVRARPRGAQRETAELNEKRLAKTSTQCERVQEELNEKRLSETRNGW